MTDGLPTDRTVQTQDPRVSVVLAIIVAGAVVYILRWAIAALTIMAGQARSSALPIGTPIPILAGMSGVAQAAMLSPAPASAPTATLTPKPTSISSATATPPFFGAPERIGTSAQGRPLVAYRLGAGPIKRALIGAIHGGYEGNTAALMTKTLEYLRDNPDWIPPELTLYILPISNPDGYAAGDDRVVARMNGNGVDLNRNWDYQWQMTATHGTRSVPAGTRPFSEPETRAMRDFIFDREIEAVIVYHSAYGAVFHGAEVATSKTVELARLIARVTGYRLAPEGVPGQVTTGDAIDYLTLNGIDAIEVELETHDSLDWERNRRGLLAFLTWNLPRCPNRNFDICRWRDR